VVVSAFARSASGRDVDRVSATSWLGGLGEGRSVLLPASELGGRPVAVQAGAAVPSLARANSNTYVASDGHFMTQISQVPVNYRSASGWFVPIRDQLVRSSDGFRQAANAFSTLLPSAASGTFGLSSSAGGVSFSVPGAAGVGSASGTVERFGQALPGVGLRVTSLSYGLGWEADLSGAARGRLFRWRVDPSGGLSARLVRRGVEFVDRSGRVAWLFSAPTARVGSTGRALPVRLSIKREARGWLIGLRVWGSFGSAAGGGQGAAPLGAGSDDMSPDDVELGGTWVIGQILWLEENSYCDLNSLNPMTSDCGYQSANAGGPYDSVGPDDHTIMNFDVSDSIPAHVRVLQAYVGLALTGESSTTATDNVGVWQVKEAWTSSANWNTYDGSTAWTTPGGDTTGPEMDFNTGVGASSINESDPPVYWWDIDAAMQQWVDGNQSQINGLLFKSTSGTNTLQFGNQAAATTLPQPDIRVYWEPRMGTYSGAQYDTQQLTDKTTAGVNVATGNLMLANQDLDLVGVAGMDVNVDRYYNSLDNGDQDSFGYNWSMGTGADTYLVIPSDGDNTIDYFDGTGDSELLYSDPKSGQWIAPPGSDVSVSMNASSTWDASQITLFFRHSGITETFSTQADAGNKYGQLQSVKDRNGNTLAYTYNSSNGQLDSIKDSYGNTTTINWGTNGYVHTIVDPAGRTYTYQQNSSGELSSYTDPDNHTTTYSYDPSSGKLDKIVTGAGNVTTIGYYAASSVGDLSQVETIERYVKATDSSGPTRSYSYGTPTSSCSGMPAGSVQTTETDENAHTITYCTDDLSRIRKIIDGNGHYRSVGYTSAQFPSSTNGNIADPGGYPQTLASNLTSATLSYAKNASGYADGRDNLASIVQTDGSGPNPTTNFAYNPENDNKPDSDYSPLTETDAQQNQTSYGYDNQGNLQNTTDQGSSDESKLTYQTNGDGLIKTSTDANGNQTSYTQAQAASPQTGDNIVTVTPPTGSGLNAINITYYPTSDYTSTTKLGAPNLIKSISTVNTSNHSGHEVDYTYDGEDREKTAIYKDAYGNTVATITYNYNADGFLTSEQDSRYGTDTYTPDGLGRITAASDYDGSGDTYTYYAGSQLHTLTDAGGTVTYKYDPANQLQYVYDPGASSPTATLSYDNDGDLHNVAYNANGTGVERYYDALDRLTKVVDTYKTSGGTPETLTYSYVYNTGTKNGVSWAGDLRSTFTYQDPGTTTNNTTSYSYDSLSRLKDASTTGTTSSDDSYGPSKSGPDAAGNITQIDDNATTTSYAFNAGNEACWSYLGTNSNACASPPSGSHAYTYDADGNETSNGNGLTMSYNALDQATSITASGTTTTYGYFGDGQQQLVSENGQNLHNDILGLAGHPDPDSGTDYFTRTTDGQPIDQRTGSDTFDYLYDGTGSVVGLVNSTSGVLVDQYAFDPYGNRTVLNGRNTGPAYFGFQGGYTTPSGLVHYGARLYNPTDARWTQPDPINNISSLTESDRYEFAGDDPINDGDPTGQFLEQYRGKLACLGVILSFACTAESKELDETYKVSETVVSELSSGYEEAKGAGETIVEGGEDLLGSL
jgi:RHS repeat-associated protein